MTWLSSCLSSMTGKVHKESMCVHAGKGRLLLISFLSLLLSISLGFSTPDLNFAGNSPLIVKGLQRSDMAMQASSMHDVWAVGSGTLGLQILSQLKNVPKYANIVAETQSESRKKEIQSIGGIEHRLRSLRSEADIGSARNVIICLPPSCSTAYTEEIIDATRLWAGRSGGGNLIYTSSTGIYGEAANSIVTESYPIDSSSPSASRLAAAENVILGQGGNVIRLAGLYTESRGPHAYWLHKSRDAALANSPMPVLPGSALALVNMLHYEDAAGAVMALLQSTDIASSVLLAVDNEPVSREEICSSALASGLYPNCPMPQFATREPSTSKICDGSRTRSLLKWEPRYPSFRAYMRGLKSRNAEQVVEAL